MFNTHFSSRMHIKGVVLQKPRDGFNVFPVHTDGSFKHYQLKCDVKCAHPSDPTPHQYTQKTLPSLGWSIQGFHCRMKVWKTEDFICQFCMTECQFKGEVMNLHTHNLIIPKWKTCDLLNMDYGLLYKNCYLYRLLALKPFHTYTLSYPTVNIVIST